MEGKQVSFKDMTQKLHTSLLLTCHLLHLNHMATASCKWVWKRWSLDGQRCIDNYRDLLLKGRRGENECYPIISRLHYRSLSLIFANLSHNQLKELVRSSHTNGLGDYQVSSIIKYSRREFSNDFKFIFRNKAQNWMLENLMKWLQIVLKLVVLWANNYLFCSCILGLNSI